MDPFVICRACRQAYDLYAWTALSFRGYIVNGDKRYERRACDGCSALLDVEIEREGVPCTILGDLLRVVRADAEDQEAGPRLDKGGRAAPNLEEATRLRGIVTSIYARVLGADDDAADDTEAA